MVDDRANGRVESTPATPTADSAAVSAGRVVVLLVVVVLLLLLLLVSVLVVVVVVATVAAATACACASARARSTPRPTTAYGVSPRALSTVLEALCSIRNRMA